MGIFPEELVHGFGENWQFFHCLFQAKQGKEMCFTSSEKRKRLSRLSLVMNLISDIDLFSSLSFSISYVFKSRMCNVHLFSCLSVFIFLLQPSLQVLLQTEIWFKYNLPLYLCFLCLFSPSLFLPQGSVYCFEFKMWYPQ